MSRETKRKPAETSNLVGGLAENFEALALATSQENDESTQCHEGDHVCCTVAHMESRRGVPKEVPYKPQTSSERRAQGTNAQNDREKQRELLSRSAVYQFHHQTSPKCW